MIGHTPNYEQAYDSMRSIIELIAVLMIVLDTANKIWYNLTLRCKIVTN